MIRIARTVGVNLNAPVGLELLIRGDQRAEVITCSALVDRIRGATAPSINYRLGNVGNFRPALEGTGAAGASVDAAERAAALRRKGDEGG